MEERNKEKSPLLLDVRNMNVDYLAANGVVHAVRNVSFTLNRGEILGLVGESGSGKSTLAFAVSRLLRPPAVITGGRVLYYPRSLADRDHAMGITADNKHRAYKQNPLFDNVEDGPLDILQLTPQQLRAFRWNEQAIVFQSAMNALNPVAGIGTQIMDVLRAHRPWMSQAERKQRAIEVLKLVGISPDRLNSYPHELSGGMRQRAVIAIALVLSPEIIIMDEPTTALDVVVQREILSEIIALRDKFGFSVIFITHDLSLLLELADKVAVMYAGAVVETASNIDVYERPLHPYSHGLLNSFPKIQGPRRRMVGIPGSPPDLRNIPPGCPFHDRCPMRFEPCVPVVPQLLKVNDQGSVPQQVACHLYDRRYRPEGNPTNEDVAIAYAKLAERSLNQ